MEGTSLVDDLIDFASITQTGDYAKVRNIPWAPSKEPQRLNYYRTPATGLYYAQASVRASGVTYAQRKPDGTWYKLWNSTDDSERKPIFTERQEKRIVEIIEKALTVCFDELVNAFEKKTAEAFGPHEHEYKPEPTPCPDGIVGCAVYHTELRCTICGRKGGCGGRVE